ncbi:hypothetical protein, partial [Bradyrhizobium sp. S3.2.12]|uniref:hypothetical protein n=1 Tax=Bradyrhizobium sp. S3.2.12 TaxID=3156387 RepID=UPI003394E0D4
APPIARCSHRAKRRNIRRDSNRYWVKLQGQVMVDIVLFPQQLTAAANATHVKTDSQISPAE